MQRYTEDFPELLHGLKLETLEKEPNAVFGLSRELRFNYFNPGWFAFAGENGGEPGLSQRFPLGSPIGNAMAGKAQEYYLDVYGTLLRTGLVWHHDYECSSAQRLRIFHQSVYPLHDRQGLIVVNSLVEEHPHDPVFRDANLPEGTLYTGENGYISQCSNCRRVQRVQHPEIWDWVPAWVEKMPGNTSHTFCDICFDYYLRQRPVEVD
ncbi:hypothetical protein [Geomesophilobacter sediminis]|uniref:Uncharacterized protein n=1 Tax=Geomesophilobacter sediminis TaxID=2798584 RepID=A0A8J7LZ12_9BACT|nr:hypothetical protein [Geomesophilobacter sediminis]MBJ6725902.1 hypothetical protein [Geomesophilobacter sediminis]